MAADMQAASDAASQCSRVKLKHCRHVWPHQVFFWGLPLPREPPDELEITGPPRLRASLDGERLLPQILSVHNLSAVSVILKISSQLDQHASYWSSCPITPRHLRGEACLCMPTSSTRKMLRLVPSPVRQSPTSRPKARPNRMMLSRNSKPLLVHTSL